MPLTQWIWVFRVGGGGSSAASSPLYPVAAISLSLVEGRMYKLGMMRVHAHSLNVFQLID